MSDLEAREWYRLHRELLQAERQFWRSTLRLHGRRRRSTDVRAVPQVQAGRTAWNRAEALRREIQIFAERSRTK